MALVQRENLAKGVPLPDFQLPLQAEESTATPSPSASRVSAATSLPGVTISPPSVIQPLKA